MGGEQDEKLEEGREDARDRGMFSQCFCDGATQVAETLCQHLSLLGSTKKKSGRNEQRTGDKLDC